VGPLTGDEGERGERREQAAAVLHR
jgi:hypothetical protein